MNYYLLILSFFYMSCLLSKDIAVVTLAIGKSYQEAVTLGIENKKAYCKHHGYDFICGEEKLDPSRRPGWNKILILLKAMENPHYKWIFWTDADALFMNFDLSLEHLIDEDHYFLITKDMFEVNPGHYFIRNNEWGRQFLLDVYSHTESIRSNTVELAALVTEMKKDKNKPFIKILPQKSMNSYAKEVIGFYPPSVLKTSIYEQGDFIIHFSGEHNLIKLHHLLEKYSNRIIFPSSQESIKSP